MSKSIESLHAMKRKTRDFAAVVCVITPRHQCVPINSEWNLHRNILLAEFFQCQRLKAGTTKTLKLSEKMRPKKHVVLQIIRFTLTMTLLTRLKVYYNTIMLSSCVLVGAEGARLYSKARPSQLVSQSSYKHMPKSAPDTESLLRDIMELEKRNCELRDEIDEDNVTLLNRRLMKLKSENAVLQEKKKTHLIEHDANGTVKSQDSPRQHRRRKSIVQSSRYSLASRFSMDGSEADIFRSSMARRTSMGALQDFDRQSLGLAINSMRLSIQKPLQDTDVNRNFLEFSMIGMNDDILAGLAPPMDSNRQQAVLLENFPKTDISYINSIPNFAFPSNVPIVILTEHSAPFYRVTPNQYHILQFSDECGTPTFACCLTVSEKVRLTNAAAISHFEKLQQRIQSMRVIVRFFRFVRQFTAKYSRSAILNKNGNIVGYVTTPRSKGGSETGEAPVAPSPSISSTLSRFKDTVTKVVSRKNTGNNSPQNNGFKPNLFGGLTRFTSDSIDSEDVSETSSRSGNTRRVSVRKSIKKKHGIVVVVQRAYCLISAQPKHSVLFKVMCSFRKR